MNCFIQSRIFVVEVFAFCSDTNCNIQSIKNIYTEVQSEWQLFSKCVEMGKLLILFFFIYFCIRIGTKLNILWNIEPCEKFGRNIFFRMAQCTTVNTLSWVFDFQRVNYFRFLRFALERWNLKAGISRTFPLPIQQHFCKASPALAE